MPRSFPARRACAGGPPPRTRNCERSCLRLRAPAIFLSRGASLPPPPPGSRENSAAPQTHRTMRRIPVAAAWLSPPRPAPWQYPPAHSHTASSRTSIRPPLKAFHERRHQRVLRLGRQLSRQQRFRAIHRQIRRNCFQLQPRGALRSLNLRLARQSNFLYVALRDRSQALRLRRRLPLGRRSQLCHFLLQPRQLLLRFAKLPVRFHFRRCSFCNRGADVFSVLAEKRRCELQENPGNQARDNREINPLEDFIRARGRNVAALFCGKRAQCREEYNQKRAAKSLPQAVPRHRASLAGPPGRGATCSTPVNSLATRSLPAATSAAALLRDSFRSAARSSSTFFRAASCSAYTRVRACLSAS